MQALGIALLLLVGLSVPFNANTFSSQRRKFIALGAEVALILTGTALLILGASPC